MSGPKVSNQSACVPPATGSYATSLLRLDSTVLDTSSLGFCSALVYDLEVMSQSLGSVVSTPSEALHIAATVDTLREASIHASIGRTDSLHILPLVGHMGFVLLTRKQV